MSDVQQYSFGSGVLFGRSSNANPTPVRFGALQEVAIDFAFTAKPLYGQFQFPIAVGRGTAKVTGKAKWANFSAQAYNDLFFGNASLPSGENTVAVVGEAKTVTANIVTATHNGAGNFVADMGVVSVIGGAIFQRVSANAVGQQYVCNETTGVYTFNSTQNAVAVLISYTWNNTANGSSILIGNPLLGTAPTFMAVFTNTFNGQQQTLTLNSCMSNKLSLATKLDDWTIPEFDFDIFADGNNNVGTWSLDN
jgi:hypothetical protein